MKIVDALKIQNYIEKEPRRAQELIPWLIQKLIISTLNENGKTHIPKGNSIYSHGWDGIVKNDEKNNPYVPLGTSYWELGTDKNSLAKIKSDYKKRKTDKEITDKNNYTYVSVIGKNVDSKKMDELGKKLSKEGIFKKVILLDASDLETWLESNFNVAIWFLKETGEDIKKYNVEIFPNAWEIIHSSTNPKFNEELYLIDNINIAQKLVEDISTKGNELFVVNSKYYGNEYTFNFIVAAINKFGDSVLKEKCIIVNDLNELKILDAICANKVIIANVNAFPTKLLNEKRNSYIVFENFIDSTYSIKKVGKKSFEKALNDSKLFHSNSRRITINCEANIINLKRMFSNNTIDRIPKWAKNVWKNKLIPLMLLGSVDMDNSGDIKVINELIGTNYDEYFESLNLWLELSDAPFFKEGSIYKIKSRLECYDYVQVDIFSQKIKLLEQFIDNILSNDKIELNKNVWIYNNDGSINRNMVCNILDGFVILTLKSARNQQHYDNYIYQLLSNSSLSSNSRLDLFLIKFVEISPSGFLSYCEDKLITDKNLIEELSDRIKSFLDSLEYVARFDGCFIRSLNLVLKLYFEFNVSSAKEKINIMMSPLSIGIYQISIKEKKDYFFNFIECVDDDKAKILVENLQHGLSQSIGIGIPNISYREYEMNEQNISINEAIELQSCSFEWLLTHSRNGEYVNIFEGLLKRINFDSIENIKKNLIAFSLKIDEGRIPEEETNKINYRSLYFIYNAKKFDNRKQNVEILDLIEEIYEKTKNSDYFIQNQYIFKLDLFPLLDPINSSEDSIEEKNKKCEEIRINTLKKMLEIYGDSILEKIINEISNISYNSWYAILSVCKDVFSLSVLLLKNRRQKGFEIFFNHLEKNQKLELIKKATEKEIKFIYSNIEINDENINIVNNTTYEKYFWIGKYFDINTLSIDENIVDKIINLSPTSMINYIKNDENFNKTLAMKVLRSISSKVADEDYVKTISEQRYSIQELIEYMDKNYCSDELAELEFKMMPIIFDFVEYPLGIKTYFWNNPKEFGKMIIDSYKTKDILKENITKRKMYLGSVNSISDTCFIPQENIILYHDYVVKWCDEVLSIAANESSFIRKLLKTAIINILASCPMQPNTQVWPISEVAIILEKLSKQDYENVYDVSRTFYCAFCNKRGIRTVGDGSVEMSSSQTFLNFKKYYEKSYPIITKALEDISNEYMIEGQRFKTMNVLTES